MDEALKNKEPLLMKLSGQKDTSLYGTQTAQRWIEERYPSAKVLILDSATCNDPSNPKTFIDGEVINKSSDGFYACELVESADGMKAKRKTQRILSYLNHSCSEIKRFRQAEIFGQYDAVYYTNACSTGLSFEAGPFKHFLQIEQGAGSIDDAMQATARWRDPDINRLVYIKEKIPAPNGNGATDSLKLRAGKDANWNAELEALSKANVNYLPEKQLNVGGNIGQLFRNYRLKIEALRNAQAGSYADDYYELLARANYDVRTAFNGAWAAMNGAGQESFIQEIRDCRDGKSAANDVEVSDRNVDGKDLAKLEKKTQLTRAETQEIAKLKAMKRYGLEADEVTPEIVAAEKDGLYKQLCDRHYLESGVQASAERDSDRMHLAAAHGRNWTDDLLRGTQAYRVQLLSDIGILDLIQKMRTIGDDDKPYAIHKYSPEVAAIEDKLLERRTDLKNVFRITAGKRNPETKQIEIERPIAIIQSLLKQLRLNISADERSRPDGHKGKSPVGIFRLKDLLEGEDGSSLIDYEKFRAIKRAQDSEIVGAIEKKEANNKRRAKQKEADSKLRAEEKEAKRRAKNGRENQWSVKICALDAENVESIDTHSFEVQKVGKNCALDAYTEYIETFKAQDYQAPIYHPGFSAPIAAPIAAPAAQNLDHDYLMPDSWNSQRLVEVEGLFQFGSSLSPWEAIGLDESLGQIIIRNRYGAETQASLCELKPWRELVPA
jgi:hypothetical protein